MSTPTANLYETVYILGPSVADEDAAAIHQKVDSVISKFDGGLKMREDWGLRQLAYPINDESNGRFVVINYHGKSGVVEEIERHFKILPQVKRYMTVSIAEEYDYGKVRKQVLAHEEEAKKAREMRQERREKRDFGGGGGRSGGGGRGGGRS